MSGTILQFPLRLGLDEDANPKAKPTSTLKTGHNIRWPKDGQIGKRLGTTLKEMTRFDGSGNVSGIRRFIVRGKELSVTDGKQLFSFDPELEQWLTHNIGRRIAEPSLEWTTLLDDHRGVRSTDIALFGRYIIHAWVTGDPTRGDISQSQCAFVRIRDRRTGTDVLPAQRLVQFTGGSIRVVVIDAFAFIVLGDTYATNPSLGDIQYWSIDLTTMQFVTSDNLVSTDLMQHGAFDVKALSTGDLGASWEGDSNLRVARYTQSGGTLTLAVAATITEPYERYASIAIDEDSPAARLYVAYRANSGANAYVRVASVHRGNMATALAATTVRAAFNASQVSCEVFETGSVLVSFSGVANSGAIAPTRTCSLVADATGAVLANSQRHSPGIALITRSFRVGNQSYAFAVDTPITTVAPATHFGGIGSVDRQIPSMSSYMIGIDTVARDGAANNSHWYSGKVDHNIGSVIGPGVLPRVPVDAFVDVPANTTAYAPIPFQAEPAATQTNWRAGLREVRITTDPANQPDPYRAVAIGHEAYIGGPVLQAWDGRSVFDYGMRSPALVGVATANFSGNHSGVANGTYLYQFTSSYRSHVGIHHRGPVTPATTINVASNAGNSANVGLALLTHSIDDKQPAEPDGSQGQFSPGTVLIEINRSLLNGAEPRRLTFEPLYNVQLNLPDDPLGLGGYMVFYDTANDSDITKGDETPAVPLAQRPPIYTASTELEDVQPPAQYSIAIAQNRIFVITGSRREVWHTKDSSEDPTLAPGFHPDQSLTLSQDATAIAVLDQRPIIFWERGLWFIDGEGPDNQGNGSTYRVQPLQSDIGCTNPRSVVSTPLGIIFESEGALYLLGRGLEISWIGKPVRDTLAIYTQITSAVLLARENEVRFTCNKADGSAGIIVALDYLRNTWITRSYPEGGAIVDACLCDGRYYFTTADTVRVEEPIVITDSGAGYVASTIVLAPISPSGPISWQRIRRVQLIGTAITNHQLTISVARDFANTTEQSKVYAVGSDVTTPGPFEHAELPLKHQKYEAIEIHINDAGPTDEETYPTGSGEGFTLEGIALLVQPISGFPRITPSRRG